MTYLDGGSRQIRYGKARAVGDAASPIRQPQDEEEDDEVGAEALTVQ